MSDRDALRSLLIYAQREAEALNLSSVTRIISQAVAEVETARAEIVRRETAGPRGERTLCSDAMAEAEFHGHFGPGRLQ